MDVLISWSKSQSQELASAFYGWLPKVVPGLRPWMSSKDIDKGKQWFSELQGLLSDATSCVVCVTKENVRSPWIYYETGAIAAKKQEVLVCPYLLDVAVSMIADGPLSQFQCTEATKSDTLSLIRSMNRALATPHDDGLLCGNFEIKWPEFERAIDRIRDLEPAGAADFIESESDILAGNPLSSEARTLLVKAASGDGTVIHTRTSAGRNTATGRQVFNEPHNPRSEAVWKQAIQDLVDNGLLADRGYKGEVFEVTGKGYQVADLLQKNAGA